jgi:hypothetical protein
MRCKADCRLHILPRNSFIPFTSITLSEVEVKIRWRTVGQSILVSGTHLGPTARFLILLSNNCGFLYVGGHSLTRGWVVQLLLGLASAVTLGSKSSRIDDHILLSHLGLPQPGGPGPHIYIPHSFIQYHTMNLIISEVLHRQGNNCRYPLSKRTPVESTSWYYEELHFLWTASVV